MNGINHNGTTIGGCDHNDYICFNDIDFQNGYSTFLGQVAVDDAHANQQIEIRLDSTTGTLLGTITVESTGAWNSYTAQTTSLVSATGVHDVYIVFKGATGVCNMDYIQLIK